MLEVTATEAGDVVLGLVVAHHGVVPTVEEEGAGS